MTRFSMLVALVALIGVGFGAGCGGDDSSSPCDQVADRWDECTGGIDGDTRAEIVAACEEYTADCADADAAFECATTIECSDESTMETEGYACITQHC